MAQLFCHVELSFDLLIELHDRSHMHWQREGVCRSHGALAFVRSRSSRSQREREARDTNSVESAAVTQSPPPKWLLCLRILLLQIESRKGNYLVKCQQMPSVPFVPHTHTYQDRREAEARRELLFNELLQSPGLHFFTCRSWAIGSSLWREGKSERASLLSEHNALWRVKLFSLLGLLALMKWMQFF